MRSLRFFSLVLMAGAAFAFLYSSSSIANAEGCHRPDLGSALTDGVATAVPAYGRSVMTIITHRKLKFQSRFQELKKETRLRLHQVNSNGISSTIRNTRVLASINMEDYPPFDPAPSSKAIIKTGPIEHGTPLMPYIPRPTPPDVPNHGSP